MSKVILIPRVKTESEVIYSPISKCGDNWWRDVRIRSPYEGVDEAYRTLPSLGDPAHLESLDRKLLDDIVKNICRVTVFAHDHLDEMSDTQRGNIRELIDRAAAYTSDAKIISDLWSQGFSTNSGLTVPPWPLHDEQGGTADENIAEGHGRDSAKWKALVKAALRNLRCAEEVAKKANIRHRNRGHYRGRRYGSNAQPQNVPGLSTGVLQKPQNVPGLSTGVLQKPQNVPGLSTGVSQKPQLGSELEEGDIELEPDHSGEKPEENGETTSTSFIHKKKKDNTPLLIAGAATLGIIALSRS